MTPATEVLADAFNRIRADVDTVLEGLDPAALTHRITPEANTIGWLVWHLLRVQDDHVADLVGADQVAVTRDWNRRFDLPFADDATGYGHTPDDVAAVQLSSEVLAGYSHDVHQATLRFLDGLDESDLDRVVDDTWDPPVTLGVRLVSVIGDDLKHLGQAEYLKGLPHS